MKNFFNKIIEFYKEDFFISISLTAVILWLLSLIFFTGCATRTEIITKYKYVRPKLPQLQVYEYNKSLNLTAYNKNGKICIKEWNGCIDKKAFINLAKYIKELKGTLKKCNNQIIEYNKMLKDLNLTKGD